MDTCVCVCVFGVGILTYLLVTCFYGRYLCGVCGVGARITLIITFNSFYNFKNDVSKCPAFLR